MGRKSSDDHGVPRTGRVSNSAFRLVATVAHNRLLVYVLIAAAMAYGVGKWDAHQRHIQEQQDHRSLVTQQLQDYNLCKSVEQVKSQANSRIQLLKVAERAVIFRTPEIEQRLVELVNNVKPLPKVDCAPLRPGK